VPQDRAFMLGKILLKFNLFQLKLLFMN